MCNQSVTKKKSVDKKKVKDSPRNPGPGRMALGLNPEVRSGWSPFTCKREEFPPSQDSRAPLLAPPLCKKIPEHRQRHQMTAVPNFMHLASCALQVCSTHRKGAYCNLPHFPAVNNLPPSGTKGRGFT